MDSWSKDNFFEPFSWAFRALKFWLPAFRQPFPNMFLSRSENLKNVQYSKDTVYKDTALDPWKKEITNTLNNLENLFSSRIYNRLTVHFQRGTRLHICHYLLCLSDCSIRKNSVIIVHIYLQYHGLFTSLQHAASTNSIWKLLRIIYKDTNY